MCANFYVGDVGSNSKLSVYKVVGTFCRLYVPIGSVMFPTSLFCGRVILPRRYSAFVDLSNIKGVMSMYRFFTNDLVDSDRNFPYVLCFFSLRVVMMLSTLFFRAIFCLNYLNYEYYLCDLGHGGQFDYQRLRRRRAGCYYRSLLYPLFRSLLLFFERQCLLFLRFCDVFS